MAEIFKISQGSRSCEVLAGAHIAIGVFDGVHLGHVALIESLPRENGRRGVLTFDPDPEEVLLPKKVKKLMSNERRITYLSEMDIDFVAVLPFDKEISQVEPRDFTAGLFSGCTPAGIHVGEGFRYGKKAKGTVETLHKWGEGAGCSVECLPLLAMDGERISATHIRGLLADRKISEANALLGRHYFMEGLVEHGRQEGADMGFATANVAVPEEFRVLGEGVYAAYAHIDNLRYKAAVSVGVSPTFENAQAKCEAHILDFDGNLYGKTIGLEFVEYLRPMKKFDDVDELIATVKGNIDWVRDNLHL